MRPTHSACAAVHVLLALRVCRLSASPEHDVPRQSSAARSAQKQVSRDLLHSSRGSSTCNLGVAQSGNTLMQSTASLHPKSILLELPGNVSGVSASFWLSGFADSSLYPAVGMSVIIVVAAVWVLLLRRSPLEEDGHGLKAEDRTSGGPSKPRKLKRPRVPSASAALKERPLDWQLSLPIVQAAAAANAGRGKGIPLVASPHICKELVVPSGYECRLTMPSSAFAEPPADCPAVVDVSSLSGQVLMQCTLTRADWSNTELRTIVVLHTPMTSSEASGEEPCSLLASCKAGGSDSADCRCAYVYGAQEELFAQLVGQQGEMPGYVLQIGRGQLLFKGNFDEHMVEIASSEGERLAAAQLRKPPGEGWELGVAAGADVGAVLCGLFAISQMRIT